MCGRRACLYSTCETVHHRKSGRRISRRYTICAIDWAHWRCRRQHRCLVRITSGRRRYFVNVSAGGFSGVVGEKLTFEIKAAWGPLAYLRSAAAALPELQTYRTTIIFDDTEELVIDLYNVVVANGQFAGGGLPIAPQANLSDGFLDVVLVPKRPAAEMSLLAAQMLLGKHISSNAVPFRRAKRISVRSRPGMWFNADGELVGNQPAAFQIIPHALDFVVSK
jgi:diacylglycerol kinase (ATP)